MAIVNLSELGKSSKLEEAKKKLGAQLQAGLRNSIETELKMYKDAMDVIERLALHGHIFSRAPNLKVTSMSLNCIYQLYSDIFLNKDSEDYKKPENILFKNDILNSIAEEEYADIVEKLNKLNNQ